MGCSAPEQISGGYGALRVQTEINLKGEPLIRGRSANDPRRAHPPNHMPDRQITTMTAVIAPAPIYGNQSLCMLQPALG